MINMQNIQHTNLKVHIIAFILSWCNGWAQLSGPYFAKISQHFLTRLCSTRRQNRMAFPISRNVWKTSVRRSGYCIMSFSWAM